MSNVLVRFAGASKRPPPVPFAKIERGDVVLRSALPASASINDHIVWIWGMLKHERKQLKRLQASGTKITCEIEPSMRRFVVGPHASEMLHILGIDLVVKTSFSRTFGGSGSANA